MTSDPESPEARSRSGRDRPVSAAQVILAAVVTTGAIGVLTLGELGYRWVPLLTFGAIGVAALFKWARASPRDSAGAASTPEPGYPSRAARWSRWLDRAVWLAVAGLLLHWLMGRF